MLDLSTLRSVQNLRTPHSRIFSADTNDIIDGKGMAYVI
jgi:hypothetical protein